MGYNLKKFYHGQTASKEVYMAIIRITTTDEDRQKVLEILRKTQGQTVPVSKIAELSGLNASRVRYCLVDLEDEGKIKKVPTKAFNKHYVRYRYDIAE
jgi:predicted Rossmann fold nucleotide-binding protein DprA/Smf involved in DNA uptake